MKMLNSMLFVPGTRPERFAKARASCADVIIVDLEDAVEPAHKSAARDHVRTLLREDRDVVVRINGLDTEWFAEDLHLVAQMAPAGVMVPKTVDAADVTAVADATPPDVAIFPLIESAAGYHNCVEVAMAPRVCRLVFGTIDFQADLNMRARNDELASFRTGLVVASRVAGISAPIDGVCPAIDDTAQLIEEVQHARRLGFGGKLCIHPRQVEVVNTHFCPNADEVLWATRVLEADAKSGGAATALDGKMIDRPVVDRAQQVLRDARARQADSKSDEMYR